MALYRPRANVSASDYAVLADFYNNSVSLCVRFRGGHSAAGERPSPGAARQASARGAASDSTCSVLSSTFASEPLHTKGMPGWR